MVGGDFYAHCEYGGADHSGILPTDDEEGRKRAAIKAAQHTYYSKSKASLSIRNDRNANKSVFYTTIDLSI